MVEDNHTNKQAPPPSPPPPPSTSSSFSSLSSYTAPLLLSKQSQQQPPNSKPPTSKDDLLLQQDEAQKLCEKQKLQTSVSCNRSFHQHPFFNSGQKILNDTQVIFNRRINFNQKARKCFELTCEEKISKHKLEEVHFSMPSSVKSTVIMTFSPDGQKVASTHNDHRIYICDLNTGKLLDTLEGHSKTPLCLAWHPSNREILASGSLAGEVRVWDLKSKACESWTNENNTIIFSIDFHPKERILVIATSNDIHFWDWNDSEPFAKTTTTHDKEKIKYVEFDPSGTKLITGISNLPEFGSFGSDSLQNRIIDSYLTQGTLDQLPTDNMTQNSEIPSTHHMNSNNDATTNNERNHNHYYHQLFQSRQLNTNGTNNNNSTNNSDDMSYRSTLILYRVAFLYRQLEALEDSMRHTSFSPYVSPRPLESPVEPNSNNNDRSLITQANNNQRGQQRQQQPPSEDVNNQLLTLTNATNKQSKDGPPNQHEASHVTLDQPAAPLPKLTSSSTSTTSTMTTSTNTSETQPIRVLNSLEPFVVSFDESLEHLQLSPLVIDGQTINLATVIEQYPIDFPWHLHYMMQFESMNQVNQNFIRISKLMSSVRLYRQIVQQISSSNTGQIHFQPNQILTAQSTSQRSVRNVTSNLPVVFRNLPVGGFTTGDSNNRGTRPTDPIMAIQFRNSARNVPLATICKIDLLSARSICLWRSQQLIEQSLTNLRATSAFNNDNNQQRTNVGPEDNDGTANQHVHLPNNQESTLFYPLVFQLHESLSLINQAPLTTSNVHVHITNLRTLIDKLLKILGSLLNSQGEGQRLTNLIHDIANSLTGRSWAIPLGACLDDIRLDVIHTLCTVDLTLHLTRQVQLLQMQRLSAIVRVEESKRLGSNREPVRTLINNSSATATTTTTTTTTSGSPLNGAPSSSPITPEQFYGPSTSRDVSSLATNTTTSSSNGSKRKEGTSKEVESPKKRKIDSNNDNGTIACDATMTSVGNNNTNSSIQMIETKKQLDNNNIIPQLQATTYTSPTSNNNNIDLEQQSDASRTNSKETYSTGNLLSVNNNSNNNNNNNILPLTEQLQQTERLVVFNNANNPTPLEQSLQRFLIANASSMSNSHILVRIYSRLHNGQMTPSNILDLTTADQQTSMQTNQATPLYESRRRALSQDNSATIVTSNGLHQTINPTINNTTSGENSTLFDSTNSNNGIVNPPFINNNRVRQFHVYPSSSVNNTEPSSNSLGSFERQPHLHVYQTRGTGHHLWFNQWTIPLPISKANCRLQCWNFTMSTIPNIKDSHSNLLTPRCRIHNDSSIDISSDGSMVGCLVPRDDGACVPNFDVKIFSLKIFDFGVCYYKLPHGPNAISVTMSPSTSFVVVGLSSNKFISNDPNDEDLIVAKVYKLNADRSFAYVRDIKTKRDDSTLSLNAIKWMPRGIVYNVGPQHYQRYQTGGRIRNTRNVNT